MKTRVGVFGWGVVAPRSKNVEAFRHNLEGAASWLEPFEGFGPSNFLVGKPDFDFEDYRAWFEERFPPRRFTQLSQKMGTPTLYALGAFVQALQQAPRLEKLLQQLGAQAHIYVGTGLGDLPTIHDESIRLYHGQRRWSAFWSAPERNAAVRSYREDPDAYRREHPGVPPDPADVPPEERSEREDAWWSFWSQLSDGLMEYLAELRVIDGIDVGEDIETSKAAAIRRRQAQSSALRRKWSAPEAPWNLVSANVLWNIHNTPASQISMIGGITGMTFAPVAACSTFGYALRLAMSAIRNGEAKVVVVGAADPVPHGITVGPFFSARVLANDGRVSKPLTGLRGTHVSGGAVIWIVGNLEFMRERGFEPIGMEPIAVSVTADADHIISPSKEGPIAAIRAALTEAGVEPGDIVEWDLHATATPGDYLEVETLREILPAEVLITARKGTFGHGMSVGGGWELMAQYLAHEMGKTPPTPLVPGELNPKIARIHAHFVYDEGAPVPCGPVGKLSMGVGGINACVISRPWEKPG